MRTILAIDPGRDKCGLAVVAPGKVLHRQVVPRSDTVRTAAELISGYSPDEVIIGNGTGSAALVEEIRAAASISVHTVEEAYTSQRARARFFDENPPGGLKRLVPRGLLTPDRPYDDYVAVILAEDHLNETIDQ